MASKPKLILFGAGLVGRQALPQYQGSAEVIAFADNDVRKQGDKVLGVPVIRPERIVDADYDQVVITSTSSGQILDQLLELGVPEQRIRVAGSGERMLAQRFPWDAVLFLMFMLVLAVAAIAGVLIWLFG